MESAQETGVENVRTRRNKTEKERGKWEKLGALKMIMLRKGATDLSGGPTLSFTRTCLSCQPNKSAKRQHE